MVDHQLNTRAARLIAAAVAVLTACSLLAAPAGASLRGSGRADDAVAGRLVSVSCPAARACWAVGEDSSTFLGVMAHWDGSAWTQVRIPGPKAITSSSLVSVSCPSTTFCWVVGGYHTMTGDNLPYVLNWNGTRWSMVKLPRPPGTTNLTASSVSCSSTIDCWEAAQEGGGLLFEHWDGTSWTMVPEPAFGEASGAKLSCVSASDCWMVGSRQGMFSAHWDGSTWSAVQMPPWNPRLLSDLSCAAAACMAVGSNVNTGNPFALWRNGSAWRRTKTVVDDEAKFARLSGVSCTSSTFCMAVGLRINRPFSETWDGAQWHVVVGGSRPIGSDLDGVTCLTASDCWAVGHYRNALFEHWNGHKWTLVGPLASGRVSASGPPQTVVPQWR
jgi:hypothetical protein